MWRTACWERWRRHQVILEALHSESENKSIFSRNYAIGSYIYKTKCCHLTVIRGNCVPSSQRSLSNIDKTL